MTNHLWSDAKDFSSEVGLVLYVYNYFAWTTNLSLVS